MTITIPNWKDVRRYRLFYRALSSSTNWKCSC